jgi:hypothetical protein
MKVFHGFSWMVKNLDFKGTIGHQGAGLAEKNRETQTRTWCLLVPLPSKNKP